MTTVTWHGVSSVQYAGEAPIAIPYMPEHHKRFYKPEVLMATLPKSAAKTFGKDGEADARQYLRSYIFKVMEDHDWEMPESVELAPWEDPNHMHGENLGEPDRWGRMQRKYRQGATFGFHSPYGMVELGLYDAEGNRWDINATERPELYLSSPGWAGDIQNRRVTLASKANSRTRIGLPERFDIREREDYEVVRQLYRAFWEDPWSTARKYATAKGTIALLDMFAPVDESIAHHPAEDFPRPKYTDTGPVMIIDTAYLKYMPDRDRRPISEDEWRTVERVFEKFESIGVQVELHTGFDLDGTREIKGLSLVTPQLKPGRTIDLTPWERGQLEEHRFTFTEEGVTIGCGYLTDESRFARYQARLMKDFIDTMEADDEEEEEIEVDVLEF